MPTTNESAGFGNSAAKTPPHRKFTVLQHLLPNGLRVLAVENPTVPAISIHLSILSGARNEPPERAGLAMFVSRLLDEGTTTRSSAEIAELIESVGGSIDVDGSFERIVIGSSVLREDTALALGLVADIAMNPVFPDDAVSRERERILAEIRSSLDRPQVVGTWALNELIYGAHPLHRPLAGYPDTVRQSSVQDLKQFHANYFRPNNAILSIVGDFKIEELLSLVEQQFMGWRAAPTVSETEVGLSDFTGVRFRHVPMDSEQVSVYLGHLGISRKDPDFYVLQVLETILGGGAGFTARIPQRLRDELGLAYTTYASLVGTAGMERGRVQAYIATSPQNVDQAIDGLLEEMRRVRVEAVTESELNDAKEYLTGSFVFAFETSSQIARFLTHAHVYGLGFDYVYRYRDYVNAVTVDQVRQAAFRHLNPDGYGLVVVGPKDLPRPHVLSGTV